MWQLGVKAQGLDTIDANAVAKAFKDVFEGNDLRYFRRREYGRCLQDLFRETSISCTRKVRKLMKLSKAYLS